MPEGVTHTACERHPQGGPTCWHQATPDDIRNLGTAMHLSGGNIAICEALLRGETVPLGKLDQEWVRRLGRR